MRQAPHSNSHLQAGGKGLDAVSKLGFLARPSGRGVRLGQRRGLLNLSIGTIESIRNTGERL